MSTGLRCISDKCGVLQFKVLREGRLFFNRDNALRGRYETGTMMRYYDFRPFLDYYNRCLRERIKAG